MATTQAGIVLRHLRGLMATDASADRELVDRFASQRDERAFEALLQRHGPMVLGVCRRVLANGADADDAFQATFLTLAGKANSIGKRESVGGWLYQVAYRTALQTKVRAVVRQRRERKTGGRTSPDPLEELTGRELLLVLDEELHNLPERWRAPLVACYLEGKTRDEAAGQLGWTLGTLKRRLEQGRTRLRQRLSQRGLELPAALMTIGVATAAVPAALASSTAAGALAAAGQPLRALSLGKSPVVAVLLLTMGLGFAGAMLLGHHTPAAEGTADKSPPPPAAPATAPNKESTVIGHVVDVEGNAVADAEVVLVARGWDFAASGYRVLKKAKSDKDGGFRLTGPRLGAGEVFVLAGKAGFGLRQVALNPQAARQETTLTLPAEQSIRGRLLDLQGQPAAGVKVVVLRIGTRDDLGLWEPSVDMPLWPKPTTSDAEGFFTLTGLPRNQEVWLEIYDDRFARQTLRLSAGDAAKEKTWTLTPGRLLEGKVLYEDTGKPAANARISMAPAGVSGRTDDSGRFKLSIPNIGLGLVKTQMPPLTVYPAAGEPYLAVRREIAWPPRAVVKHAIEVKLPRGVLVRGKVIEAPAGQPVAGAGVQFVPREAGNPNLRPDVLTRWENVTASGSEGIFQMAVPPGPGHLLVSGPGLDFIHEEVGDRVLTAGKPGGYRINADGLVKLDLAAGAAPKEVTITLRRGVTVPGRLLDPEGKPVGNALMICRLLHTAVPSDSHIEVHDGVFELHGCDPDKEYPVAFLDSEHGWGATTTVSAKQAGGEPVTIRLAPCGKAIARFLDPQGNPMKARVIWKFVFLKFVVTPASGPLEAAIEFEDNLVSRKERVARKSAKTDTEGRFTYPGLIPGATYQLSVLDPKVGEVLKREFRVEAGKTIDLRDVSVPRP
jgi:RNA polymerase sigma factor (sigma-70 family)